MFSTRRSRVALITAEQTALERYSRRSLYFLGLVLQAPAPMDPLPMECTAPRVPRIFHPLAPFGCVELPPPDSFGSTSPVPPVGSIDAQNGGLPRRVERRTASVVPPLFFTPECAKVVASAVWTCVGEIKRRQGASGLSRWAG